MGMEVSSKDMAKVKETPWYVLDFFEFSSPLEDSCFFIPYCNLVLLFVAKTHFFFFLCPPSLFFSVQVLKPARSENLIAHIKLFFTCGRPYLNGFVYIAIPTDVYVNDYDCDNCDATMGLT